MEYFVGALIFILGYGVILLVSIVLGGDRDTEFATVVAILYLAGVFAASTYIVINKIDVLIKGINKNSSDQD